MDRSIEDVDASDGRGDQVMSLKELGLSFSTIRPFAVPVILLLPSVSILIGELGASGSEQSFKVLLLRRIKEKINGKETYSTIAVKGST